MRTSLRVGFAVGALALVIIAAVAVVAGGRSEYAAVPSPESAAAQITADELAAASSRRLFFGHMSVGKNVLSGVNEVHAVRSTEVPAVIELVPGESIPQLPTRGGMIAHSLIGKNRDPEGKLANFDAALRKGVAEQVDIAMLKFCYIDITWDTDVDALFASYEQTLAALEKDFPEVTFIHVTAPLTTPPATIKQRIKVLIGRDDNATRERFNQLMRETYAPEQVFDLASIESKSPLDGTTIGALQPGYSSDGAHLNDSGSTTAAVEFLRVLASTSRT